MSLLCLLLCSSCASSHQDGRIMVYTRDATSGTREAFFGFIDVKTELTITAIEVSSNGDMANKIGLDSYGIGYVSLDTNFSVTNIKALTYQGVIANKENVINKTYTLARSFNFVTRAVDDFNSTDKQELVAAFCDFLSNSKEGALAIISAGAIVDNDDKRVVWAKLAIKYPVLKKDNSSITIVSVGSTSVEKVVQALFESFQPLAGNCQFQLNQTGSGDGYKRVLGKDANGPNKGDIGFASRSFKKEENITKAMNSGVLALDAVVIVISENNNTVIDNITKQQAYAVFSGAYTKFSQLLKSEG